MSETFGDTAAALFPQVARLLGCWPDVFWAATPAEIAAMLSSLTAHAPFAPPLDRSGLDSLLANAQRASADKDALYE